MNIKRMLMLAGMALGVLAFAAPAAQAEWTHDYEPLTTHETIHLSGWAEFGPDGANRFGCEVHATLTVEPGSTGEVTNFAPTTGTCEGTGSFAGCELTAHEAENLPWEAHANTANTDIVITDVELLNQFQNCFVSVTTLKFPEITAVPDDSTTISTVEISGNGTSIIGHVFPVAVEAEGVLHITGGDHETYGIAHAE